MLVRAGRVDVHTAKLAFNVQMELNNLVIRVTIALMLIMPSTIQGGIVQNSLVHLPGIMTKKDKHHVVNNALPVPSAHQEQLNQYRVKPENLAQLTQALVKYVPLAFTALLQKKKSFVHRAHIVKEMLQPVKIVKLDIIVYKVLDILVQKALTIIKLIKVVQLVVSIVLVDTIARIKVRRIHIKIHVNQDIIAMIEKQNVGYAQMDTNVLMQV